VSIYEELLDQVRSVVDAIVLTGNPTVVRRKRFTIMEQDPKFLIVVSPTTEIETEEDTFENALIMAYPIVVGITTGSGNLADGTSEDLMLTYRQAVRRALRSLGAVAISQPVIDVSSNSKPAFDLPAARDNRDVSAIEITYFVQEPRN
jgi:hypothetical protein